MSQNSRFFIPALGMLSALVAMAMDMYLPSLPQIAKDLEADFGLVQQTLSVFLIGIAFSQIFYGPISDRFGRRWVLFTGVSVFGLVSAFCAQSTNIDQLIHLRWLQALGAGAGSVIVAAIVRDLYQGQQAARVMSYVIMVMMVVPLLAPLIGGYVLIWLGWRAIFWLLVCLGFICAWTVVAIIPETNPPERRQSLSLGRVLSNYRHILSHSKAMGFNLCSAFSYGCLFAFISGSPYLYIEYFGISPEFYGYLFGCNIVLTMICAYLNSQLIGRFSSQSLLLGSVLVQVVACSCLMLISLFHFGGVVGTLIPIILCVGMIGMISANATASMLSYFTIATGTASGVLSVSRFGIAGIASAAVGFLHDGSNLVMPGVMLFCVLVSLGALVLLAGVRSSRQTP